MASPPEQKHHSLSDAAAILGVSVKTVKRAVASGDLAVFNGGQGQLRPRWFVTEAALRRYVSRRRKRSS